VRIPLGLKEISGRDKGNQEQTDFGRSRCVWHTHSASSLYLELM